MAYENELFSAARRGNAQHVEKYLDKGAAINSQDRRSFNFSALHHSVLRGHVDVMRLLLARGSDVAQRDGRGYNVLQLALFIAVFKFTDLQYSRNA